MDIGTIISFTIANALASFIGACFFKKKYPKVGTVKNDSLLLPRIHYLFLGLI